MKFIEKVCGKGWNIGRKLFPVGTIAEKVCYDQPEFQLLIAETVTPNWLNAEAFSWCSN